jgi:hypothetical protein
VPRAWLDQLAKAVLSPRGRGAGQLHDVGEPEAKDLANCQVADQVVGGQCECVTMTESPSMHHHSAVLRKNR